MNLPKFTNAGDTLRARQFGPEGEAKKSNAARSATLLPLRDDSRETEFLVFFSPFRCAVFPPSEC
jgi:hypothetical protein